MSDTTQTVVVELKDGRVHTWENTGWRFSGSDYLLIYSRADGTVTTLCAYEKSGIFCVYFKETAPEVSRFATPTVHMELKDATNREQ
ncbi:MAG TPA: hypothetical protein VHK27_13750 [Gammaproteobacteria bacterium]|nr:hypothetical protein [Gammaproteobacteria bacterium]